MCKGVSNVKTIDFCNLQFLHTKCIISEQPHMFDDKRTIEELEASNRNFDELEKYWKKFEVQKTI